MTSWDPGQYLRFAGERLRPALDLLARVALAAPARVTDLGCGAGNVTAVLCQRFPGAAVVGVDGSVAMLAKAREAVPDCRFAAADIGSWVPDQPQDLIYSNAALHWLGDHAALFPRLLSLLAPGGVLAVQMPAMHDSPMRRLQQEVAAAGPWADRLRDVGAAPPILATGAYWDILRRHARAVDIWETTYWHPLSGEDAVAQWAAGSSLRPFLDRIEPAQRGRFLQAYADALKPHYTVQDDGTTLLPFRRFFLVAGL